MSHRRKLRRFEIPGQARFLTFSCESRLPLLTAPGAMRAFAESLASARDSGSFELFAWVVMPEHVHLLIRPRLPEHPVPGILRSIKEPVARSVLRSMREADSHWLGRITRSNGRARFWLEGGGFDRNVRDRRELAGEAAYIHHNPVRRGLVEVDTEWAWSSARWYAGERENQVPIDPIPPV
ncbi:MAG: transposase [Phycisphaerales bacterium JB040]